jgi:hypothetical protein
LLGIFKLVYLSKILDRTSILSELASTHLEGGPERLSTFFDLASFSRLAKVEVVEWPQVKIKSSIKIPGVKESLSWYGSTFFVPAQSSTPLTDIVTNSWGFPQTILNTIPLAKYDIETVFWPPPAELTIPFTIQRSMNYTSIESLVIADQAHW